MVFSSITFLFYFLPVFLLIYYIADKRYKNWVILLGSIFFYAWGAPRFVFVILGTTAIDFYLVRLMEMQHSKRKRKLLLCLSLAMNLGLLFYFKYCGFFVENLNAVFAGLGLGQMTWLKLALPIGISFYTFESITYIVDVYRRVHKPLKNFWDYQLYIILFPKLIAGPIVRYHEIADQIYDHVEVDSFDLRLRGFFRFVIGLSKKIFIANVMGEVADEIFALPASELTTATAWLGALSYTFQIYFDFSGYSDMAIGLGMLMGFRFPENFNNPYTSRSITDFWRRWHMTLGAWMRDYLYIPLGGNRVSSKSRQYLNLWIVFFASGLWHGAAWGFIFWGLYHGFFLVIERMFLSKYLSRLGRVSVIYSFVVVLVGWVFFRMEELGPALNFTKTMFGFSSSSLAVEIDKEFIFTLGLATIFSFFTLSNRLYAVQQKVFYDRYSLPQAYLMTFGILLLIVLAAARITTSDFNPFIYFRF